MIISVPLSRFSRKLILAKYEDSPIKLRRDDLLHIVIRSDRIQKTHRPFETLTTSLDFALPYRLPKSIEALMKVGYQIHLYHINQLISVLDGAKLAKGAPHKAIKDYCGLKGIDIDDIDFDSLYRSYQRKRDIYWLKKGNTVLLNTNICKSNEPTFHEYFSVLLSLSGKVIYDEANRLRISYIRAVSIYLEIEVNGLRQHQVAKKYRISQQAVSYNYLRIQNVLHSDWMSDKIEALPQAS